LRTTLNIDDEALAKAMEVSPGKTKTEVVNEALRELARRARIRELANYAGKVRWEGNLDELRGRVPRQE
jgi:Arc/MetJ family transcription regulator